MVHYRFLLWLLEVLWNNFAFKALDDKLVASSLSWSAKDFECIFVLWNLDNFTHTVEYLLLLIDVSVVNSENILLEYGL